MNRPWALYFGVGLIVLGFLLAPFWYVWTMHAFYPAHGEVDEAMNKPWRPFARLALSSFMTVTMLVLGALLLRMQHRNGRGK